MILVADITSDSISQKARLIYNILLVVMHNHKCYNLLKTPCFQQTYIPPGASATPLLSASDSAILNILLTYLLTYSFTYCPV